MAGGEADRRRVGRQRLHEHPPGGGAATGAAGELRDEREGALLGAEVGEAQGGVGVDHDAEVDVGEVVALGHHLRADQDAARGRLEGRQDARRVGDLAVEAEDVALEL